MIDVPLEEIIRTLGDAPPNVVMYRKQYLAECSALANDRPFSPWSPTRLCTPASPASAEVDAPIRDADVLTQIRESL